MAWVEDEKKLKPPVDVDVDVGVGVVDVEETATEPDEIAVRDDEMEVESEVVEEVEAEPVGTDGENDVPMEGTMVLAASVPTRAVAVVLAPAAAQSVADTVTVDTTVTVTILSVPMTTVGVTIPFVEEEVTVAAVAALDVLIGTELGGADDGVRDVVTGVETDEGVEDKI